jgi:outer membrane protein assembly factor BamB
VWGVVRSDEGDRLTSFDPENLTAGVSVDVQGRVTFGPEAVGDDLLLSSTGQGLVCLDADGKPKWTASLTSELVGAPTQAGDDYLVGLVEGRVLRINAANGKVLKAKLLNEPIRTPVLTFGERVMTTGVDGTLLVTSLDTVSESETAETTTAAEIVEKPVVE